MIGRNDVDYKFKKFGVVLDTLSPRIGLPPFSLYTLFKPFCVFTP